MRAIGQPRYGAGVASDPRAPSSAPVDVADVAGLDSAARRAVLLLVAQVSSRDGEPPLNDHAMSLLSSPAVQHLLARQPDGTVAGYAQLEGAGLELVGMPGAIAPLLDAAQQRAPARLKVWSHGERSAVAPVLQQRGFRPVRVLHQLGRDLREPVSDVPLADGVVVRDFVPGQDDEEWLAVNAAAFATHPEQGRWTREELSARQSEPWFDPHGFLVAERGGRMLGFHWTKVHANGDGEVYVLGVHPDAQGLRLGPALLARGLRRLAERGCPRALLYVDDDNAGALRLYQRFGFEHSDTDTQWVSRS